MWREKGCDYLEFFDEQLQQCITLRKIVAFRYEGQSIAKKPQNSR